MLAQSRNTTLRSAFVRLLLPRVLALAGFGLALVLGQAMAVTLSANPSHDAPPSAPVMPTWTPADAIAHPECTPAEQWPHGRPAPFLVVHDFRAGADRKLAFRRVWRRTHNATEVDDVWVVGVCAGTP
jgi:hypothetical protein